MILPHKVVESKYFKTMNKIFLEYNVAQEKLNSTTNKLLVTTSETEASSIEINELLVNRFEMQTVHCLHHLPHLD